MSPLRLRCCRLLPDTEEAEEIAGTHRKDLGSVRFRMDQPHDTPIVAVQPEVGVQSALRGGPVAHVQDRHVRPVEVRRAQPNPKRDDVPVDESDPARARRLVRTQLRARNVDMVRWFTEHERISIRRRR